MNQAEKYQLRFEKIIEILIMYKRENLSKDVYLSEKCTNEAIKWYQEKLLKMSEL
tara:strand:- start:218 stop:382 length:165 start_codon:yes stop_codon:yes gene_type:complete